MSIKVVKQKKENSSDIARRFIKTIKKSGLLLEMRKKQYQTKELSPTMKKAAALKKIKAKKEYDAKRKLGKI